MNSRKKNFICNCCHYSHSKWEGRCRGCGEWNSLEETLVPVTRGVKHNTSAPVFFEPPIELAQLKTNKTQRKKTGMSEFDRVLGGGIVPGSTVLITGAPGAGKSTLLLQVSEALASSDGMSVLFVSGEESIDQIGSRARRLGVKGTKLFLAATNRLENIINQVENLKPSMVVVDSVQTLVSDSIDSPPGSVTQVQTVTQTLAEVAKSLHPAMMMTGHVTKEGGIAGPRVLEHLVDAILQLDGDRQGYLRTLHGIKNRFGTISEIGVFEMKSGGLIGVEDPSRIFLADRHSGAPGSAVVVLMEGSRPIAVEIQALTTPSNLPSPRRVVTGIDSSRLHLALAVIARRLNIRVANQDVIINVPGGLRVREPAADLGLMLALVSSFQNEPVASTIAVAAEVGLGGELRSVPAGGRRAGDARRLGLTKCLLAPPPDASVAREEKAIGCCHVSTVQEAVDIAIVT